MTTEVQKHLDNARDILVGKVPDPKQQIDQITNALIYKFMDDMDQESINNGGQVSFFAGNLEQYAWHKLMDPKIGAQERLNKYTEALEKFSTAETLPQLFRDIFRQAFLPYRDPATLDLFLKEIEYFDYSHSENLGDAFEYLLSIMGAQGDAGQFRTPRHIIDFMVEVIDPKHDETILDPACGTAGFLISVYKHILKKHDGLDDKTGEPSLEEAKLTYGNKQKLLDNLTGYDISSDMVKLARANMYLHGNKNPHIEEYDSLTSEKHWDDNFDIIIANPPFMSPKGGIVPHNKFSVQSTRAEVLFVDYIASHLKLGGRATIVVPEGIIFQSGKAYKSLRKMLVEDHYLVGVISLPAGVFNPYSGVKTSILWLDKTLAKKKKEIIFAKVEEDGLSHGTRRRPIGQNDLPEVLEAIKLWSTDAEVTSPHITTVTKAKLRDPGDYNLSANRYVEVKENPDQKWPMVKIADLVEVRNGLWKGKKEPFIDVNVLRNTNFVKDSGDLSFDDVANIPVETRHFDQRKLDVGDIILENSGGGPKQPVGRVAYFDMPTGNYSYSNFTSRLRVANKEQLNPRFLWLMLRYFYKQGYTERFQKQTSGIRNLDKATYLGQEIPVPPIEEQQKIIEEIESKQKAIDHAREIIKTLERETPF